MQAEPGTFRYPEETLDHIVLDRHQEDLQLTGRGRADNLVVPDDFFQRKRHILLGLVLNDLGDLRGVNGWKPNKFREGVKARGASVDAIRRKLLFGQKRLQLLLQDSGTGSVLEPILPKGGKSELMQAQCTRLVHLELGELKRCSPKIDCQKGL